MSELKVASCFEFEKVLRGKSNKLFYPKSEVDSAIDDLKREHNRERHEYIDWVNRLQKEYSELKEVYKDSVDVKVKILERCKKAEDEIRRLKRALYKACANWADVVAFENTEGIGYDNSAAERWRKMESKCLKKAEEYK